MTDGRRRLPSIDRVLQLPEVAALAARVPRNVIVAAAREAVADVRQSRGGPPDDWGTLVTERVAARTAPSLFPVVNATGVVLHTNLGRAPLAAAALEAVGRIGAGYSNLELDVATGSRGNRLDHAASLLAECAGADDAIIVNNAAGALVLVLNGLGAGREIVISRGELVEIGGSFRIPDILEKSGAILREVGTTNRTHLADYERAIGARTGAILLVHRSNFSMAGFVASPAPADIATLGAAHGVPVIHDVGSGLLLDLSAHGLAGEPSVPVAARTADLVVFSGDKLLGGPQAGCVVGRRRWIEKLRKNPFVRAMRADKLTLAALEATLQLYRDPAQAVRTIPVLRMLTTDAATLSLRAERLAAAIPPRFAPRLEPGHSAVGGGSFPEARLPTTLVTLDPGGRGAHAVALDLRLGDPSILARVIDDRVVLDPRTLTDEDLIAVGTALGRVADPE